MGVGAGQHTKEGGDTMRNYLVAAATALLALLLMVGPALASSWST